MIIKTRIIQSLAYVTHIGNLKHHIGSLVLTGALLSLLNIQGEILTLLTDINIC
jgi:hypothetical protein